MDALSQAEANIRSTLNLDANPANWTYDQRVSYNKSLSTFVNNNASSFSPAEVAIANGVANSQDAALDDTGFLSEGSDFLGALEDEAISAGEKVAGIGNGILNFASLTQYLIPIAGITIVGILLWSFYKKKTA